MGFSNYLPSVSPPHLLRNTAPKADFSESSGLGFNPEDLQGMVDTADRDGPDPTDCNVLSTPTPTAL